MEYLDIAVTVLALVIFGAVIVARLERFRQTMDDKLEALRLSTEQRLAESRDRLDAGLNLSVERQMAQSAHMAERLDKLTEQIKVDLDAIRSVTEKKLDEMRGVVDEKLQKTLEERIGKSFEAVSKSLADVYAGLGQMNKMASEVGDLKKVLSNVKTRGMLGEYQLGALLEQILSPEQYMANISTDDSRERVEYVIKMPGDGGEPVLLPVDSKFPLDRYAALTDAYESGDRAAIDTAVRELRGSLLKSAQEITKYIKPPKTTDFAILFLPFEGLYAEVIRLGMLEELNAKYRVNITGPSTMGAFLNSLQMGFRTLRIQKSSGEVWKVLAQTKKEFEAFGDVLTKTQDRINMAGQELDKLVGVRSRQILRALKNVETDMAEPLALPEE